MKPTIQELITLYNNTESRIERANLWSHIEEWVEIFAENKYPNEYETSHAELREFEEFKELVRRMREAQRNYYKDRPKVGYKVAYQNMINKEQLVDEYLKKMEI